MSSPWPLLLLGYIWALPNTLIGLLCVPFYRPFHWRWNDGCIEAIASRTMIGGPAAQTWGWLIYYASPDDWADHGLAVHERVHVAHALLLGPLFLIAYAGHWLWLMVFTPPGFGPRWWRAYMAVWSERVAYERQRQYKRGRLPDAWGA